MVIARFTASLRTQFRRVIVALAIVALVWGINVPVSGAVTLPAPSERGNNGIAATMGSGPAANAMTTAATASVTAPVGTPVAKPDGPDGARVFASTCAACHIGGTNVLLANKNLSQEALEKFAMNSVEAIRTQVTQGKNAMPSFAKKLTPEEIDTVAGYVLQKADAGW
jgi:cytochrome c6